MISKSGYQMWLTFNAEAEKIRLPVLPTSIKTTMGTKDQSVDIVGLGEILIAQSRPAVEFSFSSFFPKGSFPGIAVASPPNPQTLKNKIETWKNSNKPVHFIVTGMGIDCYCRIAKFVPSEDGGDVGTIKYDIALKEYRAVKVRQVKVSTTTAKATVEKQTTRTDNSTTPQTYKVVWGDCLWNLAKRFLGNGAAYMKIYNANPNVFKGRSPNMLYVGETLVIPK